MNMCAKFEVDILKTAEFCRFEYPKRTLLTLFMRISEFSYFQILSNLVRSKGVLGSFFCVLVEKGPKNMHHTTQTENLYLTFLTS